MAESPAAKAIQIQLADLLVDPPPGVNAGPEDDNIFQWAGFVMGPPETPYEGGLFALSINFSEDYPYEPPRVKMTTPIYHPNISEKGDICLSILFKDCNWDNPWSPALSISAVLLSIVALLAEPNASHPMRPDVAKQYDQDRPLYNATARALTDKHAKC